VVASELKPCPRGHEAGIEWDAERECWMVMCYANCGWEFTGSGSGQAEVVQEWNERNTNNKGDRTMMLRVELELNDAGGMDVTINGVRQIYGFSMPTPEAPKLIIDIPLYISPDESVGVE